MFRPMSVCFFLLCLCLSPHNVLAQSRGLSIVLRTEADANAPVAGRVELYKNSYALVIGNDGYNKGWPKLSNAIADAEEIANALAARGFDVTFVKDLDSVALQNTLNEFFAIKGADPDARLLLWYAGHGHSIKGEGFLVPIDAPAPGEPEFKLRAMHMRNFGSYMRLAESKHVLAIFDSCFSGTIFTTRAGAVPAAITRATTKPARQFMTSGDADQEVSDDGTFRRLFLNALQGEASADSNGDGYLTATELGLYLSDTMTNYSEQAQTPRYGKLRDADYTRGDFVFALPSRLNETGEFDERQGQSELPASNMEAMAEITLWTTVLASNKPDVVQSYLDKYPTGLFAKAAKDRVADLKKQIEERETAKAAADAAKSEKGSQPDQKAEDSDATTANNTEEMQSGESDAGSPADAFMPEITESEGGAVLELKGGFNLSQTSGKDDDSSWLPTLGDEQAESFQLATLRTLPEGFFGTGEAAGELSGAGKPIAKNVGPQGYRVNADAWRFSDPQGDSQYKIDREWIHMRAPGNHNIWDCRRHLAPILSVPAPASDIWSAQVWFQLPARIGRSHVGIVLWNGIDKDGPSRAMYFGPSNTKDLPVSGSYRSDCSASVSDLRNRGDTSGRFNAEYPGGKGWLRLSRKGDELSFYFKSPSMHSWHHVGTMLVEGKDNLTHVGLIAKTWGNEPVVASFADFRLIPGHADSEQWHPAYYSQLAQIGEARFVGKDFADFEWNDPAGDSIHEISGEKVQLKASGGHNIWDCHRKTAPILSVDIPPLDRWTAEVDFELPARIGRSHVGLATWNGEFEDTPVYSLYFGPSDTGDLGVAGSNAIDCSSSSGDLSRQLGSKGAFNIKYNRSSGRLRLTRDGNKISFYFKAPERRNWEHVGTTLASVRDALSKVGLIAKTWGSEPVNVTFSNFRILAGETEPEHWFPSYYAGLRVGQPLVFAGNAFADFEWSDPDGNSVHEIRGSNILLKTTGGHSGPWDCKRNTAPILSVAMPPRDAWVAQVRYRMRGRKDRTSAGITLWNGSEHGSVKSLSFGPSNKKGLYVGGPYSDDCSGHHHELAKQEGNSGAFTKKEGGSEGILQVVKFGWSYRFRYFDPAVGEWSELGSVKSTVMDNFNRIGLTVTSWGSEPVEAEFRDFTLVPGLFN